jgi:hypothetical protein
MDFMSISSDSDEVAGDGVFADEGDGLDETGEWIEVLKSPSDKTSS